jgi:hypothetical protein
MTHLTHFPIEGTKRGEGVLLGVNGKVRQVRRCVRTAALPGPAQPHEGT